MASTPISRRTWIAGAAVFGGFGLAGRHMQAAIITNDELIANPRGGYSFIPKVEIFSLGVVANKCFEIVRVSFRRERPFPEGLNEIEAYLRSANRPMQALCGIELRSGRQLSMPEFLASNKEYVEQMKKFDLLVEGRTPLVRTNVAVPGTESNLRIHAFDYTRPAIRTAGEPQPTFISAGIPDVSGLGDKPKVVAEGDVTRAGLRLKTGFILDSVGLMMKSISAGWDNVTGTRIYTVHDIYPVLTDLVMPKIGAAARRGIELHYSQLPVVGGDIEMDVRSVSMEAYI